MLYRTCLIITSALFSLTTGVAALAVDSKAGHDNHDGKNEKRSPPTPTIDGLNPCLPHTLSFKSALAKAPSGVKAAVEKLQSAEANPQDHIPIVWGGSGINCDGGWRCSSYIPHGHDNSINDLILDARFLDMDRMYYNEEHIMCIDDGLVWLMGKVCVYLEDVSEPVSGLKVAILLGFLANHECVNCGKAPLRFLRDQVNDLSDGALVVDVVNDDSECAGVCGHNPLSESTND